MIKKLKALLFGIPLSGYTSEPQGIHHSIIPQEFLKDFPVNDLKNEKFVNNILSIPKF